MKRFSTASNLFAQVERFGGPDVLKLKDTFVVPPLTPNQVLVRVMYFGVNPVETYIREGQYSRWVSLTVSA